MSVFQQIAVAVEAIRAQATRAPKVGVILGSGLGDFAETLSQKTIIPFAEVPGFPISSVSGHPGRLVFGDLGGAPVVAMQGRVHLYEGYSAQEVAFPARVLCALGIESLVVTNASGGIRSDLAPGDLMMITDHINLSGANPLNGPNDERLGPRFPDMSEAYDPRLRQLLRTTADRLGIELKEGVYVGLSGPSYETPAEIRFLRTVGGDAVGMSTVPEVLVAVHRGVRVAGICCVTNAAAGLGDKPLSHSEVARTAERVRDSFACLLTHFLPAVASLSRAV